MSGDNGSGVMLVVVMRVVTAAVVVVYAEAMRKQRLQ